MRHSPQLIRRLKMPEPIPTTPVGERLLHHDGPEALSMMLAFQQTFGARVLHYQDPDGQVGTLPEWATDVPTP